MAINDEKTEPPQVIHCQDKEKYDEVMDKGPFEDGDFEYPDLFILAASIGYAEERKEEGTGDWLTRTEYLGGGNSDQRWLLRSIAMKETEEIGTLRNGQKIFDIAIQYANGGIKILHDKVFSDEPGSVEKRLEEFIREHQ